MTARDPGSHGRIDHTHGIALLPEVDDLEHDPLGRLAVASTLPATPGGPPRPPPPAPMLPDGVRAPTGVDADALAACIAAARRRPRVSTTAHLERLARVARLELSGRLTQGPAQTLQQIVEATHALLPDCGGVSVILFDANDQSFRMSASTVSGLSPGEGATRVRSRGATRFVVESGQALYVRDVAADPFGANTMLVESRNRSYVGLPLRDDGATLGAFYAMAGEVDGFSDEDVELLAVVADRAAMVIRVASEHAWVRRIAMRSEVLSLLTMGLACGDPPTVERLEAHLRQVVLAVDFDALVVEPGPAVSLPRLVVGRSTALVADLEDPELARRLVERLTARHRAGTHVVEEGPLAGTALHAVRERAAVDDLDRSTLRHLGVVLAIPFRRR